MPVYLLDSDVEGNSDYDRGLTDRLYGGDSYYRLCQEVILGIGGTASLIRHTRANLLDQLRMPYVTTARSKGLTERRLLLKYPVRVAMRPFVATVGYQLPRLVSAGGIVAVVLSLPTSGPLLLRSLMTQDMFLAGSFLMMLSFLTVIGTLISDVLLALLDPRIRYEGR